MTLQNSKTKIISIVNQKGGVGKTTTAINLATTLAILKKKVLIIDLDPQGNASTGFGIEQSQRQKTIYQSIINEIDINEAIIPTKIKKLHIITSTVDLAACEVELSNIEDREYLLKNNIEKLNNNYDFIIIDCPPSLGILTINALAASTHIIIPMQCEFYSLEGLSHLLTTLDLIKENINDRLKILGIVLTMKDKRNKLTEQVETDVREFLDDKVFINSIPRNIRLSEAPSHGLPGVIYDKNSLGAQSYISLSKEIVKRINKETKNVSRETSNN